MEFWRPDDGIYLEDRVATFVRTLAFDETLFKGTPNTGVVTLLAGDRGVGGGHVGSLRQSGS